MLLHSVLGKKSNLLSCLFLLSLCYAFCTPLRATRPFTPEVADKIPEAWRWAAIPELRNLGPRCISQGADGKMWFGVAGGITSYDGYEWTKFELPTQFAGYSVTCIAVKNERAVYVGTDEGLLMLKQGAWTKLFPFSDAEQASVSDLIILPDGSILAGLKAIDHAKNVAGLLRIRINDVLLYAAKSTLTSLSPSTLSVLKVEQIPPSLTITDHGRQVMSVRDLLLGRENRIYVAVSGNDADGSIGIFRYDRGMNNELRLERQHSHTEGLNIRGGIDMAETETGDLWVVSRAHDLGVQHFDGRRWTSVLLSDTFGGVNSQSSVLACSDGTIWVDGHGRFFRLSEGDWKMYEYPEVNISTASRFTFYETADKSVWVLGFMSEVFRFDNTFDTWATYENLNFQLETDDGTSWFIGARGGVVQKRFGNWQISGTEAGLMNQPVRVFTTSYGEMWAVGSHEGVAATAYLNDDGWKMKLHPRVSWGIDYRAVFEDRDGSLWFGCGVDIKPEAGHLGGVLELRSPQRNKTEWIHHATAPGDYLNSCYGIGQSSDGVLWFGGKKLHYFSEGEWGEATGFDWLGGHIDVVQNAPDGTLWVGTRYHGIAIYDGKEWRRHTVDDGLPSNNIISIDASDPGNVWVATYGGVCHYDGEKWTANLFPQSLVLSPENTRLARGTSGFLWFNRSGIDWRRRGMIWPEVAPSVYAGHRTVAYNQDKNPPRTRIITKPGEVDQAGNVTVFWAGNDYFEQTTIDELQYSFRLNEETWSNYSPEKYHRFEGLPAGDYRLEVRSRDRDFNVDSRPPVQAFQVLSAWWLRPQFLFVAALALLTIGVLQYLVLRHYQRLKVLNVELEHKSGLLRQRNEQVREQKGKLEHSLAEIQEISTSRLRFFTNVSHEFRTPLSLILGPVDELLDGVNPVNDGMRDKYYTIIQRNGQRILRLINQILQIYKVEDSSLAYRPVRADLTEFVRQITTQFGPLANQRGVTLLTEYSGPSLFTEFDGDKIEKILFNLLSNAFKNVSTGGTIRVELDETAADNLGVPIAIGTGATSFSEKSGVNVKLSVTDDGSGIPADSLTRIFDRFYQVKKTASADLHLGLGIGLSYIKELVGTHGGTISVTSDPGVATTFTVLLPSVNTSSEDTVSAITTLPSANMQYALEELRISLSPLSLQADKSAAPDTASADVPTHKTKLLIVEDDLDTRIFLRTCFEARCKVIEATNGEDGLTLAKSEYPDLIISDVTMPKMDGIDFCTVLKNDFDTSHIPVILLTARTREEEKIRGFRVGADAYIEKPFSYRVLESRVAALIRSRDRLRRHFQGSGEVDTSEGRMASVDEEFLQRAISTVEEQMDNSDLDAQGLSHLLGVSRIQLYRKLKALTGQTVNKFVRSVRLKHASQLLIERNLSISEIAYKTGFAAPNHFSTYFKKHYGVSPSAYQRKHGR
ncbi:response regulator [Neolewinella antarctica]|uniref:histidine kinase n=1 Tax=Neolewinella antarctica TaxID=442734 RepID=A0ABX0X7A5_9BACT|nr:response regulator [Neolewinella antarctica]NJC24935.1 signal transduction histidine kinase/DNA-binding response OmpR family regulator/ligand-binding sensor domain-containing protein [Neolewinella antarctica]